MKRRRPSSRRVQHSRGPRRTRRATAPIAPIAGRAAAPVGSVAAPAAPAAAVLVGVLLFGAAAFPLSALDLSLNGRNHAVLTPTVLAAHARPEAAAGGRPALPLEALYPWMDSVDYLEVTSGANSVYWDAARLGPGGWDGALLVDYNGTWEVRVGRDVFSDPDRIAVRGAPAPAATIRIWSAAEAEDFEDDLRGALALRGLNLEWRSVDQPENLLADPPVDGRPHLIVLDDEDAARLGGLLTERRPVASRSSLWYAADPDATTPLALDARDPEAALLWLLAENPALFDDEGRLPDALVGLFRRAAASRRDDLVVTDMPMATLAAGAAAAAVHLPSSEEPLSVRPGLVRIDPPEGAVNLIRRTDAAVPANLSAADGRIADRVLADAARQARGASADGVALPADPRVLRFLDAYERIGRLAVGGQMDAREAAGLIQAYVDGS